MIVSRDEVIRRYDGGLRIAGHVDQYLAIAKQIVSETIQRPVSEMMAMHMPNSADIAVRGKPFKNLSKQ